MAVEYVPGTSFLHRLDSRVKLIAMLVINLAGASIRDPFIGILILLGVMSCYRIAKIPRRILVSISYVVILSGIFWVVLGYLFSQEPYSPVYIYVIPTTLRIDVMRLLFALSNALRFAIFVYSCLMLVMITPMGDLCHSLVAWKLPAEISIALSGAFASAPLFVRRMNTIMEAQSARGMKYSKDSRNPVQKLRAFIPVLMPSLFAAVNRSVEIAATIEARGFSYDVSKRTYRALEKFRKTDYVVTFVLLVGSIIFAYANMTIFNQNFVYDLFKSILG